MREYLKKSACWLDVGCFWAGVLLVLPACGANTMGTGSKPTSNLDRGDQPRSSMIMCHIEKARHCPTSLAEIDNGIRFSDAAIALVEGRTAPYAVDDTEAGKYHCNGEPEIVEFESGSFPEGVAVCLNCNQITVENDATAICQARCYDFHGTIDNGDFFPTIPPTPEVKSFCDTFTRIATNGVLLINGGPDTTCYPGLCTATGSTTGAPDPRTSMEPVIWTDLIKTQAGGVAGNDLTRNIDHTPGVYDAGAVSKQWITHGNAYLEFSAASNSQSHVIGLSEVPAGCTKPADCPDDDAGVTTIGFAIKLHSDGMYYLMESGATVEGGPFNGSFGDYGQQVTRFRITLRDNGDGTANVSFAWLNPACPINQPCFETVVHENTTTLPSYPFRVDASLLEKDATLTDVRVVRIQ